MPISFTCGQCRKPYVVSDGLAGKKAMCKQCGNRMVVPSVPDEGPPVAASTPPVGRPVATARLVASPSRSESIPRARPISTSQAAPIPKAKLISSTAPPVEDIYGLNEAPSSLPPLRPIGRSTDESAEAPVKKKKKKKGFFAFGGAKKSSSSASYSRGEGMSGLRLIGLLIAIASAIFGGVRGFGLLSKSDVVAFHYRIADKFDELTNLVASVNDVGSAQRVAPRCQQILEDLIHEFDTNGRKKARIQDIKAVEREVMPRLTATRARLDAQVMRLQNIPGAIPALSLQGPMMRLEQIANELAAENARLGVH